MSVRRRGFVHGAGVVLCALLAGLHDFSAVAQTAASPSSAGQQSATQKRGLLYEIKGASSTMHLFGTIHVGKQEFYPLNDAVTRALSSAKRVYLEVDITDTASVSAALDKWAFYPDGTTLDRKLPPALMKRVREKLTLYSIPDDSALRMKPWLVAQTIILGEAARAGYDPNLAVELYLSGLALAQGKELKGLETLDEQFAIFDKLSEDEQRAFLEAVIDEIDSGRGAKELTTLAVAWAAADPNGMEAARKLAMDEKAPAVERKLMPRLLGDRNVLLADRIADIVRGDVPAFVGVGALHLVGPGNVVELLRKRGFKVTEQ